jgi:proteasome accessory factor B
MSSRRLERLINLVAALLDAGGPIGRTDLCARVPGYGEGESARRAFERDKETLRSVGIPLDIVTDGDGNVDRYVINRDRYELPELDLTDDELAALHLAVSAVRLDPDSATELVWKLGGAPKTVQLPMVQLENDNTLADVFAALVDRSPVKFSYRNTERTVDPWRLSFRSGHWYLQGREHAANDRRIFRLDRVEGTIRSLSMPNSFDRPPEFQHHELEPWEVGDTDEVIAHLLVDASHVSWATSRLGHEAIVETMPDGSATFQLRVRRVDAFRTFVLGFLEHAEVVAPAELRRDIIEWLEPIAAGHAS